MKRKVGRPKLNKIQLTVKIEPITKKKLMAEAMRRRSIAALRPRMGQVIDWLVKNYLN
jgi:hypothetical protein